MGQFTYSRSFRNTAVMGTVSSSDLAGFPASRIHAIEHPYRTWRSGATITIAGAESGNTNRTYVGINFGGTVTLDAVMIDNINVAGALVQHSSNGTSWTTDGTLSVTKDGKDGKYKYWLPLTAWNFQYIRVTATTATTTNGITQLEVGSLVAMSAVTEMTVNPGYPYAARPMWPHLANADGTGFGRRPVATGNRYAQLNMASNIMPLSMEATFDDIAAAGYHAPIAWYRNNGNTAECYVTYTAATIDWSQEGPNHIRVSALIAEECS